jgi:hypothetical protein
MQKYTTADGGTVEATRRGLEIDLHVRDAAGRTVATVVMSGDDAYALLEDLDMVI